MERLPDEIPVQDRILVVDDEPRLRHVWEQAIRNMGFCALGARSGEEALQAALQQDFGVVMLDLNLPGMSGMELFRELRKLKPTLAVIIVTGFGSLDIAREAMHLDAVEFLTKPAGLGELERAIDRSRRRALEHLPLAQPSESAPLPAPEESADPNRVETMEEIERNSILTALRRNDGNRTAAARELGISLRTLHYRVAEYQRQGLLE